jgi:hypothetical protein
MGYNRANSEHMSTKRLYKTFLPVDNSSFSRLELFLEKVFSAGRIDNVFWGNVETACTRLLQLIAINADTRAVNVTAIFKEEQLQIEISGIPLIILQNMLKKYQPEELNNKQTEAVFLIQKVTDAIQVKKNAIILCFDIAFHKETAG